MENPMGEAEDQAALERIEYAEKRLVAMQELGLDTASLLSQLYNARFRVQAGASGEVEALCKEVLATARRMVDGDEPPSPRRPTWHQPESRDEESTVADEPGIFIEPNIAMSPGDAAEPSITISPGDAAEPSITMSPGDAAEPSIAMSPGDAAEPSELMGPQSGAESYPPQVEQMVQQRVVEAVIAIQETMREEMRKSLDAMRAEFQQSQKKDTALIVIPAGAQTPVWSGKLGEALDHFVNKANDGPLEGCETSMRKLSDALSLLGDPSASKPSSLEKDYSPDVGQGSHPATPAVEPDRRTKPGAVRGQDITEHDTTHVYHDHPTRKEMTNVAASVQTEANLQAVMSAKTERIMAAVHAASEKTIGEETLRRLVNEEVIQQLKDREPSGMGSSLEPMMVFDPDQVRTLVEEEVNKRVEKLSQLKDHESSGMGSSLEPMMVFDPDQVRTLVEEEVNKRMAQLPPPPTASPTAPASETLSDAEWHQKLVQFLPDVLKNEDVRQRLIALVALEAVANPGALGELTGLRGFLRRELRRAVEDVARDTQPA
jgi:hypothetical protein